MNKRNIHFGMPIFGPEEENAVLEVLKSTVLVHGPKVKQFEIDFSSFTSAPYSLAVASCTAALHLAYFYQGIGEGDEVIVPAQTHIATAHAVELCGGRCVFIDSERETGNIDIDQIESKITSRTRAISVVHYLGMPVQMDRIQSIAHKYGLFVVEDCALSIGARYKGQHTGLFGDVGCFSFYPVKHMTTVEGGMLITKDPKIAEKIGKQRAFGVDRVVGERKVPGHYDTILLGFNYRMNEMEAAIGIEQLKRMPNFLEIRRRNYDRLYFQLKEINEIELFLPRDKDRENCYYCLSFILKPQVRDKRLEIIQDLNARGIGTSIYYPRAVPLMKYYSDKYGVESKHVPIADEISSNSIALSVGPHLTEEDMNYMATHLKEILHNYM